MKTIDTLTPFDDVAFYKEHNELVEANFTGKNEDKFKLTFTYRYQTLVTEVSSDKIYAIKNKEGESSIPGFEGKYDIVRKNNF
jgi:hypothetical protein